MLASKHLVYRFSFSSSEPSNSCVNCQRVEVIEYRAVHIDWLR